MKKFLLISFFFPPANFVGAQRTAYWAENLHKYGYYPIVITRRWNDGQTTLTEKVVNNELAVEKFNGYEVHRLPYKETLRDKLDQFGKYKFLQKALTLKEIVLSNFSISALPYSNFYGYAKSLIQSDSEIGIVMASGRPFQSFAIGHQLKKDFPQIHWIPDYRDEWTRNLGRLNDRGVKFFNKLEKKSEQKWTSNASLFLTVSELLKKQMTDYLPIKGEVVMNGVTALQQDSLQPMKRSGNLRICYAGTVYPDQNFNVLIESINQLGLVLEFVGGDPNTVRERIKVLPKKSKEDLELYFREIDVLVVTPYNELPSCLPVKLFDYFQTGKPILLCPSDNDVMEEFITKTNSGYIANTVEECTILLEELLAKKQRGESIALERNMEEAYFYSRAYQTKKLAEILDGL